MSGREAGEGVAKPEDGGEFTALDYHNFTNGILRVLDEHNKLAEAWLQDHYSEVKKRIQAACKEREQKLLRHPTHATYPAHMQHSPRTPKLERPPDVPVEEGRPSTLDSEPQQEPQARSDSKLSVQSAAEDPRKAWDRVDSQPPSGSPSEAVVTPRRSSAADRESSSLARRISTAPTRFFNLNRQGTTSDAPQRTQSQFANWLTATKTETPKTGSLREKLSGLMSKEFDVLIGCLVVVNTVTTFVQLEYEQPDPDGHKPPQTYKFFEYAAHMFNLIFLVELVARIFVKMTAFFLSIYNWLDLCIVVATLLDTYILSQFSETRQNISFIRMLRFLRLVKALRVIRTMELFRQLRVLLNTIAVSFLSLFWSMLIVFIFMLMFSLLMCQLLQPYVIEADHDPEMRKWIYRYYGSSGRALWTVFEATFSGGWPNYARPVVENVGWGYSFIFALYVTGVVFAMIRIISALFLKDTLQIAANDADMLVSEKMKEMKSAVNKLEELFQQADESGDGFLSREELEKIMSFPRVQIWMSVFGLDVSETSQLFDILDDGDGLVSYDEFVTGIMRLKGTSRSQDTITIMRDCERICKYCEATQQACEQVQHALQKAGFDQEGTSNPVPEFKVRSNLHAKVETASV